MPDTHATLEAVSDETLARRIASGVRGSTDAEETELYRRFAPRVRLYGRRHLQNDAGADDLAQEVLLLTIQRLRAGEVRRPDEIGSFILGPAGSWRTRNAGSRGGGKRWPRDSSTRRPRPRRRPWMHSTPRVGGVPARARRADRLVVLLTFYADREAPRIAADLGVSPGAVRVIRHRAMARLRRLRAGRRAAMTAPRCERFALAELTDYAAGELPDAEAAALSRHTSFVCWLRRTGRGARRARARDPSGGPICGGRRFRDGRRPESTGARGRARADIRALARGRRPLRGVGRR